MSEISQLAAMYAEAAGFDSLGVGGVHIDMIRNFASSLALSDRIYASTDIVTATGVLYMSNIRASRPFPRDGSASYPGGDLSIDPSRKVPVGAANKPRACASPGGHKIMSDYVHNAIVTQSQETPASKKRAFRIWCIENEVTITELAARIGISQPALSTALCKETIPVRRHERRGACLF